jgi:hypothetical protein
MGLEDQIQISDSAYKLTTRTLSLGEFQVRREIQFM